LIDENPELITPGSSFCTTSVFKTTIRKIIRSWEPLSGQQAGSFNTKFSKIYSGKVFLMLEFREIE
jgi:hypothetical protein